jgi:peptidoglycan/xylan/chitin deacetylase (PgdA/CDA1 family)
MFHRVIAETDPAFSGADGTYTVSTKTFVALLTFFRRYHRVVSLEEVSIAASGRRKLPEFPLLITFDDGWRDNLLYAAPLLAQFEMPAVVFSAMDAVSSPEPIWWQERIFFAHRTGVLPASIADIRAKAPQSPAARLNPKGDILDLVCAASALDPEARAQLLEALPCPPSSDRMMLRKSDLPELAQFRISVGVHGMTHLPLTRIKDAASEMARARVAVQQNTGNEIGARALAFPHGRYDDTVIEAARACGYELLFSSDPHLTQLDDGLVDAAKPIGRINLGESVLCDGVSPVDGASIAATLWLRETR